MAHRDQLVARAHFHLVDRSAFRRRHDDCSANPPGEDDDPQFRPFRVHFPEPALDDLRRRVAATNWPEKETVSDDSQGVPLALMQAVARYWATGYDWRKVEAKLNALPQFVTSIDGLDIHYTHVRSRHPNALPMIVVHGWPGSILHKLKIIDPLTNPGAQASCGRVARGVQVAPLTKGPPNNKSSG